MTIHKYAIVIIFVLSCLLRTSDGIDLKKFAVKHNMAQLAYVMKSTVKAISKRDSSYIFDTAYIGYSNEQWGKQYYYWARGFLKRTDMPIIPLAEGIGDIVLPWLHASKLHMPAYIPVYGGRSSAIDYIYFDKNKINEKLTYITSEQWNNLLDALYDLFSTISAFTRGTVDLKEVRSKFAKVHRAIYGIYSHISLWRRIIDWLILDTRSPYRADITAIECCLKQLEVELLS